MVRGTPSQILAGQSRKQGRNVFRLALHVFVLKVKDTRFNVFVRHHDIMSF